VIELAGAAAHVVVADLARPALDERDHHHLARVLRLRPGERVSATDGRGAWRWCTWTGGSGLDAAGDVEHDLRPRRPGRVGVAFALVKGDRPEWIVRSLTEVGVDVIVPFVSDRTVVRWDESKREANVERLRRVAHDATMQSRRIWAVDVEPVTTFASVVERPGAVVASLDADDVLRGVLEDTLIVIGPEGGWSEAERAVPAPRVRLSTNVLRTETACLTAAVRLLDLAG
jgi:16S rRNA (uracil1498-N3)-methyltransferase